MPQGEETETVEVAVVGAGPAGLAVAIKLHKVNKINMIDLETHIHITYTLTHIHTYAHTHIIQAGFTPLRVFEKAADVGGAWECNTYPGCGCDVPAHLYSLSFEPSVEWTRMYASQPGRGVCVCMCVCVR